MNGFGAVAPWVLLQLYALATLAYGVLFFTGRKGASRIAGPLLQGAVALHLGYLAWLTWRWEQFPGATVSQALTVVAFAIGLIYLFLEWLGGERASGFWLVGQVLLFQALSVILHDPQPPRHELFEHPLFGIHVFLALLGYAAFAVAACYGFLFLRLYRELKRSRFSVFYGNLPPLEVLERMMSGALVLGFAALTGALLDGIVWVRQLGVVNWQRDPIIVATLATWLLYGGALTLRRLRHWQGRQTAMASLAGIGVIVVSLVAVRALVAGFHRAF